MYLKLVVSLDTLNSLSLKKNQGVDMGHVSVEGFTMKAEVGRCDGGL